MTTIISHRGNLDGPGSYMANTKDRIRYILNETPFSIEVDIRSQYVIEPQYSVQNYYLGHDEPEEYIDPKEFLNNSRIYYHAKDLKTFMNFREEYPNELCFSIDKDDVAVVSNGIYWTPHYDEQWSDATKARTIVVLNDLPFMDMKELVKYKGICTDYPILLAEKLKQRTWI